ncbi:hypothetical protein E7Z59_02660 [Robertkochia marina]|uniref:Uncharacterized protein n=1 Tax=Robertkochia marina TaxID=1227945 RepID=A0A4S3M4K9_9FLAO|nr:hypothetical protein [Robertkochia marina]THD69251.1 hypothetical protein E7Z59_02660 [Robertkochia marina]TRZ47491.1 hypothetical protein D3A96_01940 [Robertkochia marina]
MRLASLLLLFCIYTSFSKAQSSPFLISESDAHRDLNNLGKIEALYTHEDKTTSIFRMQFSNDTSAEGAYNIIMNQLSPGMEEWTQTKFPKPKSETLTGHTYYQDEIHFFFYDKIVNNKTSIILRSVNLKNKEYTHKVLFAIDTDKKEMVSDGKSPTKIMVKSSSDGRFVAIISRNSTKAEHAFTLKVVDMNEKNIFFEKKLMDQRGGNYLLKDLYVNENGRVYSLVKEYFKGKQEKQGSKRNYRYLLHENNPQEHRRTIVDISDLFVSSLKMEVQENTMNLIGFYGLKMNVYGFHGVNKIEDTDGLVMVKIDKSNLEEQSLNLVPVSEIMLRQLFHTTPGSKTTNKRPENMHLDHLIRDEEGNLYVIGESYEFQQGGAVMVPGGMNSFGGPPMVTFYTGSGGVHGDMIIFKLNAAGILLWGRGVLKNGVSYYTPIVVGQDLHILFNAGKKPRPLGDGRTQFTLKAKRNSSLFDLHFNAQGRMSYTAIRNNSKNSFYKPLPFSFQKDPFLFTDREGSTIRFMSISATQEEVTSALESSVEE